MKFMFRWRVHPEKRQEALKGFSQMTSEDDLADLGENVKLIGRWRDLQGFTGVAILESDDASAIASLALNWNSILDVELTPVLDDAECRALGKLKLT